MVMVCVCTLLEVACVAHGKPCTLPTSVAGANQFECAGPSCVMWSRAGLRKKGNDSRFKVHKAWILAMRTLRVTADPPDSPPHATEAYGAFGPGSRPSAQTLLFHYRSAYSLVLNMTVLTIIV
jgi:hypothetical protein